MKTTLRLSFAGFALIAVTISAIAAPPATGWEALVDQRAQNFHDPFAELSSEQLFHLSNVLQLREQLNAGAVTASVRPRLQARLASSFVRLRSEGLDPDWLLFQRESVAHRRAKANAAGNPSLNGKTVVLAGFTIPAPPDTDGAPTAYLVPEKGMCSHIPPPPPNQMVRVRLPEGAMEIGLYTPVSVEGRLQINPGSEQIFLLDGMVEMHSSWHMSAAVIAPWSPGLAALPVPWPSGSHWRPE